MSLFAPRTDILPEAQQIFWPQLAAVEDGFVLYGGTSIALQYGHRQSVDFDFFGEPTFDPVALKAKYDFLKKGETIQLAENTLSVITDSKKGPVKFSFFGGFQNGRVLPPRMCQGNFIRLASPLDLAVQKLKVIQVRSEKKDFLDLDCLFQNDIKLADAMGAADAVYPGFSFALALRAMCYFGEGDLPSLSKAAQKRLTDLARDFKNPTSIELDSPHIDLSSGEIAHFKAEYAKANKKPAEPPKPPSKSVRSSPVTRPKMDQGPQTGGR